MMAKIGFMIMLVSACFDSMAIVAIGVTIGALLIVPSIIREARQ